MITLGINYHHDCSACLTRDGDIVAAVEEERFTRIKHDPAFPKNAIQSCLEIGGVKPDDIDFISFAWSRPGRSLRHDLRNLLTFRVHPSRSNFENTTAEFLKMRYRGGVTRFARYFGRPRARVLFTDHHLAHAISAYACSGFEESTVIVMDARGAWESTSVWYARDGSIEPVSIIPFPDSLGVFYMQFTEYLGFEKGSDEWKVMGLAPYGKPGVALDPFIDLQQTPCRVNGRLLLGRDWSDISGIERYLGPRREPESEIEDRHRDVAFAVQEACERAMLAVVEEAVAATGCRTVSLAGGVALNSKANGLILRSEAVEDIFIQPAAADDGAAIGSALWPYVEATGKLPVMKMRHAFLGPSFDEEVAGTLRTYKVRNTRVDDPARVAADLLTQGKIVGWIQGRMEFGPRALGGRSILADPRDPAMKDRVNDAVKFRESWRPFAPSILREHVEDYLIAGSESPFMILTFQVKPEKRSELAAVTHVDGSARPQTVERDVNPLYWDLIEAFRRRTGVPAVMNTSFNLRGEPIVCTPKDAVRTFFTSGLDALLIADHLIEK